MNFRNKKHKPLEISLTPMIDVVFLLLIFFMVTTTFSKETMIKVQLPQANGQEAERTNEQVLAVTIDKSGQYFINDKALNERSVEALKKELNTFSANKNIPLIINADASAPVQSAIKVLDVAAGIGFKNITFATQKE
ncbi:MAG: biopolymer transporter ExbD [Methyloprofundus sp.]|nr:biopolymer transporter ExbD [Methyloprofundus sp.]